jgi:hypothetical protein
LIPGRCEPDTLRGIHRPRRTQVVGVDPIIGVAIV